MSAPAIPTTSRQVEPEDYWWIVPVSMIGYLALWSLLGVMALRESLAGVVFASILLCGGWWLATAHFRWWLLDVRAPSAARANLLTAAFFATTAVPYVGAFVWPFAHRLALKYNVCRLIRNLADDHIVEHDEPTPDELEKLASSLVEDGTLGVSDALSAAEVLRDVARHGH